MRNKYFYKITSISKTTYHLLLFLSLTFTFQANSIVFSKLPKYEDLINSSELIIEGTVISLNTDKRKIISHQWSPDGDLKYNLTTVITEYLIQVDNILKGRKTNKIIRIWAPFGCYKNSCIVQDNAFNLKEKDKMVFFLRIDVENESNNESIYWVKGHSLGLFSFKEINGIRFIENYYFKNESKETSPINIKSKPSNNEKIAANNKTELTKIITTVDNLKMMINDK